MTSLAATLMPDLPRPCGPRRGGGPEAAPGVRSARPGMLGLQS